VEPLTYLIKRVLVNLGSKISNSPRLLRHESNQLILDPINLPDSLERDKSNTFNV